MAHATKPSIDLEGGQSAPIVRRPSTLSARPTRSATIPEGSGLPSPTFSTSPTWSRPSPYLDEPDGGEFSTLPPSPPLPPIQLEPASPRYATRSKTAYPTPSASQPGSAQLTAGFGLEGVTVVVDGAQGLAAGSEKYADQSKLSGELHESLTCELPLLTSSPNFRRLDACEAPTFVHHH